MPKFKKKDLQPINQSPLAEYQDNHVQRAAANIQANKEINKMLENVALKTPLPFPQQDVEERRKHLEKIARQVRGETIGKALRKPLLLIFVYPVLFIAATIGAAGLAALFITAFISTLQRLWVML